MKLFKFTCGVDDKVGVFADEKEAYKRRTEVDPAFHYLHCTIKEIEIPGHKIVPIEEPKADDVPPPKIDPLVPLDDQFTGMEVPELKEWLNANGVEYVKQWGAVKLREAARAWVATQTTKGDDEK